MDDILEDYLRRELGVLDALVLTNAPLNPRLREDLRPDFVLEAGKTIYVVEAKPAAQARRGIEQLALYAKVAEHKYGPNKKIVQVLLTRNPPPLVRTIADVVGVRLLEAPPGLLPGEKGTVPLTAEKSWRVFSTLLRLRVTDSVRSLAEASGVSTGWTHNVLKELDAQGITEVHNGATRLAHPERILDLVPFERPFTKLQVATAPLEGKSPHAAAKRLSQQLQASAPGRFGFCGYTAAGLHTGYAQRQDRLDLYMEDWDRDAPSDLRIAEGLDGSGITLHVFEPDRPFGDVVLVDGVRVVEPSLALLDVAGLGYAARDLALKLLEKHDA